MALAMHAKGARAKDIAVSCGVSKRTVFLWLSEAKKAAPSAEDDALEVPVPAAQQPAVKRASIQQVAQHAGVSVSTVSNFLNRTGRMSEATQKRIRVAIEELHFAPNSLTKAIRERRTRILGLITHGISELDQPNVFTTGLLAGMNDACREADYDFLVYTNFWQVEKHYTGLNFLNGQVDGLIWVAPAMREPFLERVGAAGLPTVALLTRHVPAGVGYVNADNVGGIELVVEHLIQLGHRRLAYLGPEHSSNYGDRRAGFWAAVEQAGLRAGCREFCPRTDIWRMERYDEALGAWCSSPDRPTAVITADDGFALTAISYLEAHGYRVPDDVSIVGFNDVPNAAVASRDGLTTLRQPFREMAQTAARSLIERIEGRMHEQIFTATLDVELVVRGSTGLPPAG